MRNASPVSSPGVSFREAVERFNANVGYSGLNHAVSAEVGHVISFV